MSQVDEIMQLVYAYEAAPNDEYAAQHDALKAAIEELVSEVEYNKQHTLIECPQCGFEGAREYAPLKKAP